MSKLQLQTNPNALNKILQYLKWPIDVFLVDIFRRAGIYVLIWGLILKYQYKKWVFRVIW